MLFTALAIMLGHDVVEHQHHEYGEQHLGHHHSDGENLCDDENDSEDFDYEHLFSNFQHGESGIIFISSLNFSNTLLKQLFPVFAELPDSYIFQCFPTIIRQYSPPNKVVYFNSQHYLPSGLRAPPASSINFL